MHILRWMGSKFCVKFQRCPLKFHTKFWTHTPQNMHFTLLYFYVWFTISLNCDVISLSETGPWSTESTSGRDNFCLKNFDTFARTSVRVSKMNAVACAQLAFQNWTLPQKYKTWNHYEDDGHISPTDVEHTRGSNDVCCFIGCLK